jgi:hypothetical protein
MSPNSTIRPGGTTDRSYRRHGDSDDQPWHARNGEQCKCHENTEDSENTANQQRTRNTMERAAPLDYGVAARAINIEGRKGDGPVLTAVATRARWWRKRDGHVCSPLVMNEISPQQRRAVRLSASYG